jgi:hypothetical protein
VSYVLVKPELAGSGKDIRLISVDFIEGAFQMFDPLKFLRRIGKFVLIPIGLSLLLGAAWSVSSTKAWIAHATEVEGKVIEMVRIRDRDDGGYMFAPLVRFETTDGNTVEFQSSFRSNPPAHRTGQTVSVLYDPDDPQSAAIRGVISLWLNSIVLGFIGSMFLAIGTGMIVICSRVAKFFAQPDMAAGPAGGPRGAIRA